MSTDRQIMKGIDRQITMSTDRQIMKSRQITISIACLLLLLLLLMLSVQTAAAVEMTHDASADVQVTMQSATISWTTDVDADSLVEYGTTQELGEAVSSDATSTTHVMSIDGLEAGSAYFYRLTSCMADDCASTETSTFTTLAADESFGSIEITGIAVTNITKNSAVVGWQTDMASKSIVLYGLSEDDVSSEERADALVTEHSLALSSLLSDMTYYYQVRAEDNSGNRGNSDVQTFTTEPDPDDFLRLDEVPVLLNNNRLVISGTTRPGRLIIYVNRDDYPAPDVNVLLAESTFEQEVLLDTVRVRNGIIGNNLVEVISWDSDGRSDREEFSVIVDTLGPALNVNPLPAATNNSMLNVSGATEPGASVRFMLNNNPVDAELTLTERAFWGIVRFPSENDYNLSVIAADPAGNENRQMFAVRYDTTPPLLDLSPTDFGETHSGIFRIRGKTDPYAYVKVTNIGEFTSYEDFLRRDELYGEREFVLVDITGYILGMEREATADAEGDFEVYINLMPGTAGSHGTNNLLFQARDLAGNVNERQTRRIRYVPSCAEWTISDEAVYPHSIYSDEWHADTIQGSAFFSIDYVGLGTPSNPTNSVLVTEDGNRGENSYVAVKSNRKRAYYDSQKKTLYVSVPIDITKSSQTISEMPNELNVYLDIDIPFTTGYPEDQRQSCHVYREISFNVEKPEILSKWLSPEDINRTIEKVIRPAKEAVEDAAGFMRDVSIATFGACVAMQAYNFFSAAVGASPGWGGCAASPATYWVCDRVLCPSIPAKCDEFTRIDVAAEDARDLGFTGPAYQTRLPNGQRQLLGFIDINDIGQLRVDERLSPHLARALRDCQAQQRENMTLTHILLRSTEKTPLQEQATAVLGGVDVRRGPSAVVQPVSMWEESYECGFSTGMAGMAGMGGMDDMDSITQALTESEEIGSALPAAFLPGSCYTESCPQYDSSKCLLGSGAGLEPARGLFSAGQCGCFPALSSQLQNYATILGGMERCLQQAQIGEVHGGFCERLLAMFVCDLSIDILENTVLPRRGTVSTGGFGRDVFSPQERMRDIQSELQNRYRNILDGSHQLGLDTTSLSHKICIAGISGDWSLLEQQFDELVEAIDIEPVVYIDGNSQPKGLDFFTGKLAIGYNLYVYIIPGGRMENIQFYMECDPRYEDGQYCPPGREQRPLHRVRRTLERGDTVDSNFFELIDDSLWWYNKLVIKYDYELGGQTKHGNPMIRPIRRRGDLAFNCAFNIRSGITCSSPAIDEFGIVELDMNKIRFSPNPGTYYSGNLINVLVPMRNEYTQSFYLRFTVTYPGNRERRAVEWLIPPGTPETRFQTYNLPISVDGTRDSRESGYSDTLTGTGAGGDINLGAGEHIMELYGEVTFPEVTGRLPVQVELYAVGEDAPFYTCSINPSGEAGYEYQDKPLYECQSSSGTLNSPKVLSHIIATSSVPGPTLELYADVEGQSGLKHISTRTMRLTSVYTARTNLGTYLLEIEPFKTTGTDNTGGGAQIIYNAAQQKKQLSFNVQERAVSTQPFIDIIEPNGDYFPSGERNERNGERNIGRIPVGVNIIDPANKVSSIAVEIMDAGAVGGSAAYCSIKIVKKAGATLFSPASFKEDAANQNTDSCKLEFLGNGENQYYPANTNFQYFRFELDPHGDAPGGESLDENKAYSIRVVAAGDGPDGTATRARLEFAPEGTITRDQLVVCQGGMARERSSDMAETGLPIDCETFFPPETVSVEYPSQQGPAGDYPSFGELPPGTPGGG